MDEKERPGALLARLSTPDPLTNPPKPMSTRIEDELQNSRPLRSLAVALSLNIQRTGDFLTHWTDEILAPAGVNATEYNVLRILRGAGEEGHPPREIQRRMIEEPSGFPALMHALKSRKLVEGTFKVRITPDGMELLDATDGVVERAIEERLAGITEAEMRTTISVLERVRSGPGAGGD